MNDPLLVLIVVVGVAVLYWLVESGREEDKLEGLSNKEPIDEYELVQFEEAIFTGGTTSQRFQERIGWYIKNGYRIHTMNVVVKQGWLAGQKQTYTMLFEKLPQPMSEGAAMLNS